LEENASISVHIHQRPRAKRSSIEKKNTSAIDLVGRDQRINRFVPALEGKEKRIHLSFIYTILIEVARKGELERTFF
jgi:hypothetical protein